MPVPAFTPALPLSLRPLRPLSPLRAPHAHSLARPPLCAMSPASPHIGSVPQRSASHLLSAASASISARGAFTVAISGGSLPRLLSAGLSAADLADAQPHLWTVLLADERLVPLDHADSNYRLVREALPGVPADRVVPVRVEGEGGADGWTPSEAARDYEGKVSRALEVSGGVFDAVYLGLGPDGHTASLFPGHALLEVREGLVREIEDSPKPPKDRVTLTLGCLNRARSVAFVCTGEGKAEVVRRIFEEEGCQLPGALVVPEGGALDWFVDQPAASLLTGNAAKTK